MHIVFQPFICLIFHLFIHTLLFVYMYGLFRIFGLHAACEKMAGRRESAPKIDIGELGMCMVGRCQVWGGAEFRLPARIPLFLKKLMVTCWEEYS